MKKLTILIIVILIAVTIFPCITYSATSIDGIMGGADNFVEKGTEKVINEVALKETSDLIYNILLSVFMVIAVIVGLILGIKYMTSGTEEKANIKQTLVPYTIAIVIMFGAFIIWKMVVDIFFK